MRKVRIAILVIIIFCINIIRLNACTTAIVSGRVTPDGRPLLFKQRDTGTLDNKLIYFRDGKFQYVGLVNSDDTAGSMIWAGCNSAGFAIMNSLSTNLNGKDKIKGMKNGIIMKKALQSCATIDDFERLLESLPKPMGASANFGVIDANGGAAYFETDNYGFLKFNCNDSTVAPFGYMIRTNFSFSGEKDKGHGYIRYKTAEELFSGAEQLENLTVQFILKDVARSLKHSLTRIDLRQLYENCSKKPVFVNFRDFIPRVSTSAAVVIQGVKKGESPSLTTMWTILGFPLCSVAVPVWVEAGNNLPEVLTADGKEHARLCDLALKLKERCFPIKRGSGQYYLNISELINRDGKGILQILETLEDEIFDDVNSYLKEWRKDNRINKSTASLLYKKMSEKILSIYLREFN